MVKASRGPLFGFGVAAIVAAKFLELAGNRFRQLGDVLAIGSIPAAPSSVALA